ncbi:MAG TPA: zf-HC2 domain-containing protein [Pseudonocardiaceae bacterium]
MGEMHCNELVERVTDCLEGALDEETMRRLLDHLQICTGCDDYFNQVMVAVKVVSEVPAEPLPVELESQLLKVYREWAEGAAA